MNFADSISGEAGKAVADVSGPISWALCSQNLYPLCYFFRVVGRL